MLLARYFTLGIGLLAHPLFAGEIRWPNPSIPIPEEVRSYIFSECHEFRDWGEETVDQCVSGELYGYRAVVSMLMDVELGEKAAARYRGCAVGLGNLGGRYHRRKAECISKAFCIIWRYAFSKETEFDNIRKAALPESTPLVQQEPYIFAMSIME